jgi:outer membrane protein
MPRALCAVLLATAASVAVVPAVAQTPSPVYNVRVGYVSTERLFTESKLAQAADAKIEAEFSKRQKALQEMAAAVKKTSDQLDADSARLSDAERTKRTRELYDMDKDLQRKDREFREDLMQRKNEERAAISVKAYKLIQQIAAEEKLDLVLQEVAWFSPRIDITDKLLKLLDQ